MSPCTLPIFSPSCDVLDEIVCATGYGALDDASSSTVVGKDVTKPAGAVLKDKLFGAYAAALLCPR